MFSHIVSYKDDVISFLNSLNPNVRWANIINTLSDKPTKMLHKIKSLLWTDKSLSDNMIKKFNMMLFLYYTSLLHKFLDVLRHPKANVHILTVAPKNKRANVSDFIIASVKYKINILTQILNVMGIRYELTNEPNMNEVKIIIPTASITYIDPNKVITTDKPLLIIPDGLFNLYIHSEIENELNTFKLIAIQLMYDAQSKNIHITKLLKQRFGFLQLKKPSATSTQRSEKVRDSQMTSEEETQTDVNRIGTETFSLRGSGNIPGLGRCLL